MCKVLRAVEGSFVGLKGMQGGFEELYCIVDPDRQRNRGFFSGMLWGVSNAREGSKILTFLYQPDWCASRSYISEARGR